MPLTGCGHHVAAFAVGAGDQARLVEHIADPVKVAQEITASGGRAVALQGDVSLQADIERIFGETEAALGPSSALVNCARVFSEARVENLDFDTVTRSPSTSSASCIAAGKPRDACPCATAAPEVPSSMSRRWRPRSAADLVLDPPRLKRVEDSIPLGRIGQPEGAAELIVWLLSDQASLVTGAHVHVGGGGFFVAGLS